MIAFTILFLLWAVIATAVAVRQEFRMDEVNEQAAECQKLLVQLGDAQNEITERYEKRIRDMAEEYQSHIAAIHSALEEPKK